MKPRNYQEIKIKMDVIQLDTLAAALDMIHHINCLPN